MMYDGWWVTYGINEDHAFVLEAQELGQES